MLAWKVFKSWEYAIKIQKSKKVWLVFLKRCDQNMLKAKNGKAKQSKAFEKDKSKNSKPECFSASTSCFSSAQGFSFWIVFCARANPFNQC